MWPGPWSLWVLLQLPAAGRYLCYHGRNILPDNGIVEITMKELEEAEDAFALKALIEAVENQIADGHPREAGLVIMDLIAQGVDREEAMERMADVLAAHIAVSMKEEAAFDVNAYARDLLLLPSGENEG
tara:strand:+ start:841 stop:1227 length:387 start_codon:yes stop_codon:yes gene_type:complete